MYFAVKCQDLDLETIGFQLKKVIWGFSYSLSRYYLTWSPCQSSMLANVSTLLKPDKTFSSLYLLLNFTNNYNNIMTIYNYKYIIVEALSPHS